MLEFEGVTKIYSNGTTALKNVDLSIEDGDFVFVVGPSGAGKSTLIKLIFAEEQPTEGRIALAGKDITHPKRREIPFIRRQIGVVFQDFRLMYNWSVFDNVAFAMKVVEATPRQIERRVSQVLEQVGLESKAKNLPGQLSGGEQQRVSLARALVNQPRLLIADEPTGNLDPDTAWDIVQLINSINREGTTVLMATHAQTIVDTMHKRVVALVGGSIVRDQQKGAYRHEVE